MKKIKWLTLLCMTSVTLPLAAEGQVVVVSYGGSFEKACDEGYYKAFTAETGIEVKIDQFDGSLAQVRAQVEAGSVHWDVINVEWPVAQVGCDEGLFEILDDFEWAPSTDGTPVDEDYDVEEQIECALPQLAYATIIAYNTNSFPDAKPTTLDDFYDVDKFPGRRGMWRSLLANLEMALMADGVPPEKVYEVLATEEGVTRAFARLDTIKSEIVWWHTGAQAPQLLADQEVVMSTGWNGRIFNAQVVEKQPIEIIWDGRIVDIGGVAIVAGAPNMDNAEKFLLYSSRPSALAGIANRISYPPVRKSAWSLIGKHIPTGEEMLPHLPTNPDLPGRKLYTNIEFWADHHDDLIERFSSWLAR